MTDEVNEFKKYVNKDKLLALLLILQIQMLVEDTFYKNNILSEFLKTTK